MICISQWDFFGWSSLKLCLRHFFMTVLTWSNKWHFNRRSDTVIEIRFEWFFIKILHKKIYQTSSFVEIVFSANSIKHWFPIFMNQEFLITNLFNRFQINVFQSLRLFQLFDKFKQRSLGQTSIWPQLRAFSKII